MFDALLLICRIVFIEDSGGSTRDSGRQAIRKLRRRAPEVGFWEVTVPRRSTPVASITVPIPSLSGIVSRHVSPLCFQEVATSSAATFLERAALLMTPRTCILKRRRTAAAAGALLTLTTRAVARYFDNNSKEGLWLAITWGKSSPGFSKTDIPSEPKILDV